VVREWSGDDGWRGEGKRGRLGRFFSRVLEDPDNPLGWSLRMFRLWGIEARVHLVTVVFLVGMLLSSLGLDYWGPGLMAVTMGALFVLVLVHEFGHCLACRWVGGEADRIVMLPFGGLALTRPPMSWRANLITTAGGPAVHVPVAVLTSAALVGFGEGETVVFNPLSPSGALGEISRPGEPVAAWLLASLWTVHYVNLLLFFFNVLLVFFPFDGGRLVQATLWRWMGYRRSMVFAVHFGLFGAVLLGVVALVFQQVMLVAIAFFGGIACWGERRRLSMVDEVTGLAPGELDAEAGYGGSLGVGGFGGSVDGDDEAAGPSKKEMKRAEREREAAAELDRVLEKISREGRGSLTKKERRFLESQTAARRGVGRGEG